MHIMRETVTRARATLSFASVYDDFGSAPKDFDEKAAKNSVILIFYQHNKRIFV